MAETCQKDGGFPGVKERRRAGESHSQDAGHDVTFDSGGAEMPRCRDVEVLAARLPGTL